MSKSKRKKSKESSKYRIRARINKSIDTLEMFMNLRLQVVDPIGISIAQAVQFGQHSITNSGISDIRETYTIYIDSINRCVNNRKLAECATSIYKRMRSEVKTINTSYIIENPYYKNIKFGSKCITGDAEIGFIELFNKEVVQFDDGYIYKGVHINPNAVLDFGVIEKIEVPCIAHRGIAWMSLAPSELKTMERHIDKAHGKVINFGLGLGYFTYMAAIKDSVTKVTVVDNSLDVVNLFNTYILPQFDEAIKSKIEVIHSDAFEYAKSLKQGDYDYIFYDIWEGPYDGTDILPYAVESIQHLNCEKSYWIDRVILTNYYNDACEFTVDILRKVLNSGDMLDFKKAVSVLSETAQSVFKEDDLISKICLEFVFKNVNSIIDGTLKDEDLGFEKFLEYARSLMRDKTE